MTIKDLARLSGYSLGTVSRVLNNQPNVSEKARETIMAIVNEAGFELNTNAKNLKQQKSTSIAVIIKGRNNELFADMVEQIQSLTEAHGYPLLLNYIDEDENEVRCALQLCREKKPLGILFLGGVSENFEADFSGIGIPCVLLTNSAAHLPYSNLSSVATDDAAAAYCAVSHLIAQGHEKIAVIGGDVEKSEISRLRHKGCVRAFAEEPHASMAAYESTRFSFRGGYEAMNRVLKDGDSSVTAVFTMADVIAIGAIRCICDHGMRVPEDISVVGFDGLTVGQYYTPKLTTIRQQTKQIAETGLRLLLDAIDGEAPQHVIVPFALSILESVRKL